MFEKTDFDVVICGGGLAGLTLARHLKLELPQLSVAVIDRLVRPLPEAAFKVGESSIELGTYYYGKVLKLDKYFRDRHLPKLGLRFFVGKSQETVDMRPETGIALFPPFPSYQIDRGRLENDLREDVTGLGVVLFEGAVIDDIELAEGDEQHVIKCRQKDDGTPFSLTAHWVTDALGRRRFLQSKLGLKRAHGHQASSAWWRHEGRVDVEDLASQGGRKWRDETAEDRYFSTNHLMNKGYWVWLIPLGSGKTSVGIVTDETIHPQATYGRSFEQAMEWLGVNEPVLHKYLQGREPMDFLTIKNFSYTSAQVFSHRRWSCVGEAGVFLDPFYSVGSDYIAMANTITVEMIRRDRAGELTEEAVETFNRFFLDVLFNLWLSYYLGTYQIFGHSQIFTPKHAWDIALYWAYTYQLYVQGILLNPTPEVIALGERFRDLNTRLQRMFIDWSQKVPPRSIHVRGDLTRMHFMQLLHLDLAARRSPEQAMEVIRKNMDRFEEWAQILFWEAVQECYPDHPALMERPWINAWRIVLDPEKWAEEGMLKPETAPRPLGPMRDNFTGLFAPQTFRERYVYDLLFHILHWGKGFPLYRIGHPLSAWLMTNKPAMWVRRVFVRDYPSRPAAI